MELLNTSNYSPEDSSDEELCSRDLSAADSSSTSPLAERHLPPLSSKPPFAVQRIATSLELQALLPKLEHAPLFSLDMKTSGLQISLPEDSDSWQKSIQRGNGETFLIDIHALQEESEQAGSPAGILAPVQPILEDSEKLKIVHDASFEKEQFKKLDIQLDGIRDLMPIIKMMRPNLKSYSLQTSALEFLGEVIHQKEQGRDSAARPRSTYQAEYAPRDSEMVLRIYEKTRSIELRATPPQRMLISTLLKRLGEAKQERSELFNDTELKEHLKSLQEEVKAAKSRLLNVLTAEARSGVVDNYSGPLGIASQSPFNIEIADISKLKSLLPEIAPKVIEEKVRKEDLRDALLRQGRGQEKHVERIWNDIHEDTGKHSLPTFQITTFRDQQTPSSETLSLEGDSDLSRKLQQIEKEDSKEALLEILRDAELEQLQLIREAGYGLKLAFVETKIHKYSERICDRLLELTDGASSGGYRGKNGNVTFSSRALRKLKASYFREHYPELADHCIREHVSKKTLHEVLLADGWTRAESESIIHKVFQAVPKEYPPKITIRPNYGEDLGSTTD